MRRQKRGYMTAAFEFLTLQADMEHLMRDGTYVHTREHGAGARHIFAGNLAIGRRRGVFTSDIHAAAEVPGHVMAFTITANQESGYPQAKTLLQSYHNTKAMADKGYDGRKFIHELHAPGDNPAVPLRRTSHPRDIDGRLCRERPLIGISFNQNEESCIITTDAERLAEGFAAFVCLLHISGSGRRVAGTSRPCSDTSFGYNAAVSLNRANPDCTDGDRLCSNNFPFH